MCFSTNWPLCQSRSRLLVQTWILQDVEFSRSHFVCIKTRIVFRLQGYDGRFRNSMFEGRENLREYIFVNGSRVKLHGILQTVDNEFCTNSQMLTQCFLGRRKKHAKLHRISSEDEFVRWITWAFSGRRNFCLEIKIFRFSKTKKSVFR